jgi:hypothetical protein
MTSMSNPFRITLLMLRSPQIFEFGICLLGCFNKLDTMPLVCRNPSPNKLLTIKQN